MLKLEDPRQIKSFPITNFILQTSGEVAFSRLGPAGEGLAGTPGQRRGDPRHRPALGPVHLMIAQLLEGISRGDSGFILFQ